MVWLLLGVLYSSAYAIAGWTLRNQPTALSWFRAVALLVPPMTGTIVIVRRGQSWAGCQWLFRGTDAAACLGDLHRRRTAAVSGLPWPCVRLGGRAGGSDN